MAEKQAAPATSIDRAPLDKARLEHDGDNSVHAARFPEHVKKLGISATGTTPPSRKTRR
jgi:hypothetical protein